MECFKVFYNEISGRLDAPYYHDKYSKLENFLKSKYETKTLGKIGNVFDGPFGSNLKNDEYVDEGIPLLRVQNIKNGELVLDPEHIVYISEDKHNQLKRSEVIPGNVVITKTGWLGNAAVIPQKVDKANIRADLAGVRITDNDIIPQFLAIYINSPIGKKLCSRLNSGSTRERIVIQNMKKLLIPKLNKEMQEEIIVRVQSLREIKKQKENEAKVLLYSIDSFVFDKLGIKLPENSEKTCYPIYFDELDGRIYPNVYNPKRMETINSVKLSNLPICPLKKIADFKKELVNDTQGLTYVGLENIESNTGIFLPSNKKKETFDSAFSFEKGDVLFPKLRPYLNKVHFAKFDGVCSTEFHVLRAKKCDGFYLFSFLRSKAIVNQTSYLMTGNTLPRLQTADIENLLIPVPSPEIQREISDEVKFRVDKAELLQQEAQETLEKAKIEVEKIIMGD